MKPIRFSSILAQSRILRTALTPALVLTMTVASQAGSPAATTTPAAAEPATNWIGLTIGGAFVNGNDAGMMRRTQTNGDFYGGINSLGFSKALDKDTTLTLDGHALPGLEDYELNVDVTRDKLGYIKLSYDQFRTWYDGSGGYTAGSQYSPLAGDDLHLDRGKFSLEAGLRMENMPEVTFKYTHAFRNGNKDSLAWGDGIASGVMNYSKLSPAMWDIDEKIDTFDLDIEHTLGNTDLGLGLAYEHISYTDSRSNSRGTSTLTPYPNAAPPFPQSAYRTTTATDENTTDLFAANIHSVTRFNDNMWLSGGVAYSTVDTDTNGSSRTFGYPYAVGNDSQYQNMVGGGQTSQIVGNLNFMWVPMPDLTLTPSLRIEHEETNAWSDSPTFTLAKPANPTAVPAAAAVAATATEPVYGSDHDMTSEVGALDVRYTGINNWVLYGKATFTHEDEDVELYQASYTDNWLHSDISEDEQEYVLGANWYALSGLSFSLQGFHNSLDQSLDHSASKTAAAGSIPAAGGVTTLRPIMVEHMADTDDFNLRMTWRPLGNLSLVTRYDYRDTEYHNHGSSWSPTANGIATALPDANILSEVENGKTTSNILTECVTWNPMQRLFVQGSVSWTWANTSTMSSAIAPDADNDYLSGTLSVGYAIDDKTDITATYTYYGASDYNAVAGVGSFSGMGYGLNTQEHSVSLTLTRVLTENMVWNLRYGFITSQTDPQPDQSGGQNDFTAQMISTGLQIRF